MLLSYLRKIPLEPLSMFPDPILVQDKDKWVGWNLPIKLIMGIKILTLMQLLLENSKDKEVSVVEDKPLDWVFSIQLDNF